MKPSFLKRINRFRQRFDTLKIVGFYTPNPLDILYFTGLHLSYGKLFVHKKSVVLFVDGRYLDMAKKSSPFPLFPLLDSSLLKVLSRVPWKEGGSFGFDATYCSYREYDTLKNLLQRVKKMGSLGAAFQLKPLKAPVKQLRSVKEVGEIHLIKKSAKLLWKGFQEVQTHLIPGVRECDLALHFEIYCRQNGAESLPFRPIVAFGTHTAFPHYQTGTRKLKKGEGILLDLGLSLKGYASDMTRVLFFGKVPSFFHKLYQVVKRAHQAALDTCSPGVKIKTIDQAARQVMQEAGLERFFLHSLGHGVGLEVHEYPSFAPADQETVLEPGMVFTIEPGLYLPGKGGIRYEDMVIVTDVGCKNLFKKSFP